MNGKEQHQNNSNEPEQGVNLPESLPETVKPLDNLKPVPVEQIDSVKPIPSEATCGPHGHNLSPEEKAKAYRAIFGPRKRPR
ncbi:MAG TPA: hypothetical protein VH682_28880 [Gemmataceae bacterium]|jgi:hypothetical protein